MPLFLLLILLLIGNWFLWEILVFTPMTIIRALDSLSWYCFLLVLLFLFSWCFGE